jgi:hypothetical protein
MHSKAKNYSDLLPVCVSVRDHWRWPASESRRRIPCRSDWNSTGDLCLSSPA